MFLYKPSEFASTDTNKELVIIMLSVKMLDMITASSTHTAGKG